jgi:hypothetical protein
MGSGDYYKEQSMIRNLKVLVAAAMALAAFGVFSASGAQAAEFHCSAEPCTGTLKPDEVKNTKTSHHVFIVENAAKTESASFTCGQLDGATTTGFAKTTSSIEVGGAVGAANALVYTECTVNGSIPVTVDMNGCKYNFTASGTVTITGCTNVAKRIEITYSTASGSCVMSIGEQGPLSTIKYHNIGTTPKREVTVETNVTPIAVSVTTGTTATCLINPAQTLTGTYTTGNTIVTGETAAGAQLDTWWE